MNFFIALFDYSILNKYFKISYSQRKEKYVHINWGLHSLLIVILLTVSSTNVKIHFIMILFVVVMTSLAYEEILSTKVVLLLIYVLSRMITKYISLEIMGIFWDLHTTGRTQYFRMAVESLLFCVLHFLFISALCRWKSEKNEVLPQKITIALSVLISGSILACCLIKLYSVHTDNYEFLYILFSFMIVYFLTFILFDKFNQIVRLNHEKELLMQNMAIKENYYEEVEENNQQFRKLRHDFKNQLLTLYYLTEKDIEAARESIQAMFAELKVNDDAVTTKNIALHSICSIKFAMAKERGIPVEYKIRIPEKITMDYGEMGVLYGNLLDNAIEACERCAKEDKYLLFTTELLEENLIIYMQNSRAESDIENEAGTTKKHDRKNHGIGLKSIQKIVTRYHGVLKIKEETKYFTVKILLYGVKNVTQEEK